MNVFLSPSASNVTDDIQKRKAIENARMLVKYNVPTQSNPKDSPATYDVLPTYAIDWTIRMYEEASIKSFDPSNSPHANKIAKNTSIFEKWARNNNR